MVVSCFLSQKGLINKNRFSLNLCDQYWRGIGLKKKYKKDKQQKVLRRNKLTNLIRLKTKVMYIKDRAQKLFYVLF